MSTVAIVDYGSGNLRSAEKAFERMAREGEGARVRVTSDPDVVARADRIVLPGVGAFADCRAGLAAVDGMADAIAEAVIAGGRPFMGVCVGMQLMATEGREHGKTAGLGWIDGAVDRIAPAPDARGMARKVPHMGWNELAFRSPGHPCFARLADGDHAYFVHSYAMTPADPAQVLATTDYGGAVVAIVGRDNLIGTQFHPEKSQRTGLTLIANFLRWRP